MRYVEPPLYSWHVAINSNKEVYIPKQVEGRSSTIVTVCAGLGWAGLGLSREIRACDTTPGWMEIGLRSWPLGDGAGAGLVLDQTNLS
jgi:hypothetical protein